MPSEAGCETERLAELLSSTRGVVLSGAGISTESGIPDYRGPSSRRPRNLILYREFMSDPNARSRYWARSMIGWPRMASAKPNQGHLALASLEKAGFISGIITQNVDGLHQAAGSNEVLELHGALSKVKCIECGSRESRDAFQARLLHLNPGIEGASAELAPDGDAELALEVTESFRVPSCLKCRGMLRPDVVFFGENVPAERVELAFSQVDRSAVLLVVGSSLTVYSGFRFVRHAAQAGKPVAIVNLGPTRGDPLAALRIEGATGETLSKLAELLSA